MNDPIKILAAEVTRRPGSLLALTVLALLTLLHATGCKQSGSSGKPDNVEYYTCTMHPSVKSQDPKAKCPICSMDLVPVMKKGAATHQHANMPGMPGMPMNAGTNAPAAVETPGEFSVPLERQQQIAV